MNGQKGVAEEKSLNKNTGPSKTPEGLSKAEARAKRKEAKKQNKVVKNEKDTPKTPDGSVNKIKSADNSHGGVNIVNSEKGAQKPQTVDNSPKTPGGVNNVRNQQENANKIVSQVKTAQDVEKSAADGELSKAALRAQRRAIQEAQRLAKQATTTGSKPQDKTKEEQNNVENSKAVNNGDSNKLQGTKDEVKSNRVQKGLNKDRPRMKRIAARKDSISVVSGDNFNKQVQLFNHLYLHHSTSLTKDQTHLGLHSCIIRLGVQYMSHAILGSNSRCLALLAAIKQQVVDYKTPPQQEFCRSFESNLQLSTNYLQKCRPLAVSMTNAVRHIKWQLTQLPSNLTDEGKKARLLEGIDTYINEEIEVADKAISITVQAKIYKGDVILTYGCSSIVLKILLDAHKAGKVFSVVVVDARPLLEGREMLRKLMNAGIRCSYLLISAASFIMGRVTKVLLGAHSLLANGYVMSRAGTAQVALIAQAFNKPVLVCCETYKFCERVQTDSIVHNEIGDPDKLVTSNTFEGRSPLVSWKESRNVTPLNLMYDVTPPDLVTAVVTELAILPCTSVPVILRIKPTELTI